MSEKEFLDNLKNLKPLAPTLDLESLLEVLISNFITLEVFEEAHNIKIPTNANSREYINFQYAMLNGKHLAYMSLFLDIAQRFPNAQEWERVRKIVTDKGKKNGN